MDVVLRSSARSQPTHLTQQHSPRLIPATTNVSWEGRSSPPFNLQSCLVQRLTRKVPVFKSRAEAFNFMFAELYENGADPINAAERANSFADIISTNLGLPKEPEKPKSMIEQGVNMVKQVVVIKKEYPEVWDLVVGAIGGVIGAVAEQRAALPDEQEEVREPIDFNNLEGA